MAYPFIDWAARVSPGWMRGRLGSAWTEVQAAVADVLLDAAKEAIKARFPSLANADALPYIAAERSLEVYPAETESAFRARLRTAWDAWVWAGTHKGVKDQLDLAGITTVLREYWDWPDGFAGRWARFWVIITTHSWTDDGVWSDPGTWNDGGTWGTSATVVEVNLIKRIIRTWKAAHAKCANVIVLMSGELWGYPGGNWDAPGVWGGEAVYWPV